MIDEFDKCEQVSLEILQKNKGKNLCRDRLKNREKCEVDTEINDPDSTGQKLQICKYIGPSVNKKCRKGSETGKKDDSDSGSSKKLSKETVNQLQIIANLLKQLNIQTKETKKHLYKGGKGGDGG